MIVPVQGKHHISFHHDHQPFFVFQTYPEWSSRKQLLISGFFWGYVCLQLGAGYLGKKFGIKVPLLIAIFITSLVTTTMPFLSSTFGYQGVLACRILQGLSQGFMFPSLQGLLSLWAPLSERTKYGSIVWSGKKKSFYNSSLLTAWTCR